MDPGITWLAADLVFVDQPVKGLPVDPGGLRGRRDVAAVPLEEIAQVGHLEHPHPLLLGLAERQLLACRQREPWRLPARRGEGERPRAGLDVLGKVAPRDRVAVGERARALDNVLQLTYVARPRVRLDCRPRVVREGPHPLLAVALAERVSQAPDV